MPENKFEEKIKSLPRSPGVYLMKDNSSGIIYVGKAKDIRKRVSSYFRSSADLPIKTIALVSVIREIEYITTDTENEALILENELIKKFHPKYNVLFRDDKTYPHLKLDTAMDFPRLETVRKRKAPDDKDKGVVYFGPYPDGTSLKRTLKLIRKIFPLVRCSEAVFKIRKNNRSYERCLDYQLGQCLAPCAGVIKKREYRKIIRDITLFLTGRKEQLIRKMEREMKRCSADLDYEMAGALRDRINAINSITQKVGLHRTSVEKLNLIEISNELLELKKALRLKKLPGRIEGFDISNISGKEAVGSMVMFKDARPEKSGYRKYKIRTVNSIDDIGMMKEVVRRRYLRLKKHELALPDLVVIDGGRGHLNGVMEVLKELKLKLTVISLAKAEELIHSPDRFKPLCLDRSSPALHLLQRIRDEAHRFALSYHHKLRDKSSGIKKRI